MVIDLEMTGLDVHADRVCEVAVVRVEQGEVVSTWRRMVRPPVPMSKGATKVTGIHDADLADAPPFADIAAELREVLDDGVLVAHNAPFDLAFLQREFDLAGCPWTAGLSLDTLLMARRLFAFRRNSLVGVCERLEISLEGAHRALADATATATVYRRMVELLDPTGTVTVRELVDLLEALAPNSPMRLRHQRVLTEAYEGRHTVFIDYQSGDSPLDGVVRREIAIWLLKLPYVQAWCHLRQGERVFRADRIRSASAGTRTYEIPKFRSRI